MIDFTVGSLFSGIGGIELGLERAGMRVIWHSEIDPYASKVLAKHWPDVPNLGDITTIDWSEVERPTVVCGGPPCQPVSKLGRRRGETDDRWLWSYFAEALRVLQPDYVLVENVPNLINLGFDRVITDLAEIGYDAEWDCIRASDAGAPHQRERFYLVAYSQESGTWMEGVEAPGPGWRTSEGGRTSLRQEVGDSQDLGTRAGRDRTRTLAHREMVCGSHLG